MNSKDESISDIELNAYLDGELERADALRVETYLNENPQAAERLRHDRVINANMHRLFDPVLCENVPEHLYNHATLKNNFNKTPTWYKAAMLAGLMLVSGFIGGVINTYNPDKPFPVLSHLVQPAAFAHVVYSTDPHYPVEFNAQDHLKLAAWLSERMHTSIRAPLIAETGFELVGGRLLPSTNRMAAQFMYQNAVKDRITVYIRRNVWDKKVSPFAYIEQNGISVYYWYNGVMAYAVSGEIKKDQLIVIANAVKQSFSNSDIAF